MYHKYIWDIGITTTININTTIDTIDSITIAIAIAITIALLFLLLLIIPFPLSTYPSTSANQSTYFPGFSDTFFETLDTYNCLSKYLFLLIIYFIYYLFQKKLQTN